MRPRPPTLEELLVLLAKHRVARAKVETLDEMGNREGVYEIEMHPSAFALQAVSDIAEAELKAGPIGEANGGPPTDEEMLFASSPFPITRDELNSKPPEKA